MAEQEDLRILMREMQVEMRRTREVLEERIEHVRTLLEQRMNAVKDRLDDHERSLAQHARSLAFIRGVGTVLAMVWSGLLALMGLRQ